MVSGAQLGALERYLDFRKHWSPYKNQVFQYGAQILHLKDNPPFTAGSSSVPCHSTQVEINQSPSEARVVLDLHTGGCSLAGVYQLWCPHFWSYMFCQLKEETHFLLFLLTYSIRLSGWLLTWISYSPFQRCAFFPLPVSVAILAGDCSNSCLPIIISLVWNRSLWASSQTCTQAWAFTFPQSCLKYSQIPQL